MATQELKTIEDKLLVSLFQDTHDNQLWGEIYSRYFTLVYRQCLKYTRNEDDAFDLAEEILLNAYSKIDGLKNAIAFSSWIFNNTRNACINFTRRQKYSRKFLTNVDFDYAATVVSEIPSDLEAREIRYQLIDEVGGMLEQLPDDTREIIEMKYLQGCSLKEIEDHFQLGESAVKMRLSRAKAILRKRYEEAWTARA